MNDYIVVTTLCDKKEIADKIIDILLEKRLVSGTQVNIVHSKYWWNNTLEECDEYKIELRTRLDLYNKIYEVIKEIHDYEVFELSYRKIDGGNKEFFNWIEENTSI